METDKKTRAQEIAGRIRALRCQHGKRPISEILAGMMASRATASETGVTLSMQPEPTEPNAGKSA